MKLDYDKHYVNKDHTKHYYMNHTFDNFEWREFCNGIRIQGLDIGHSDKHRIIPEHCERWFNQDNHATNICKPCKNPIFYRSNHGGYFCKSCAREISKINDKVEFNRV